MVSIRKFLQAIGLIPVSSTQIDSKGELEVLDGSGKLNYHNGTSTSPVVTEAHSATLTNKTIDADSNTISNIENADIKTGAAIDAAKIHDGSVSNTEFGYISTLTSNAQDQLDAKASSTDLTNHINDATDAHDASAISNVPAGSIASTDVQAALNELDGDIQGHITDAVDAHDASAISNVPSGNLAATDVQGALDELQSDIDTRATSSALTTHTSASSGVHGVTGSVVGTSDSQTLTNKTLTAPIIDVAVWDDQTTPANPSAGFYKTYFKNDGKFYKLNSGGTETEIGGTTSPLTTKGDLYTYTTGDARLPVGTNGQILSADSAESTGLKWIGSTVTAPRSEVTVDSGNGHGSTATKIRRFSNIRKNTGTAITYADSATNGGTFTINEDGVYAISYNDQDAGGGETIGITVNDTATTTDISTPLTYAQGLRAITRDDAAVGGPIHVSWCGFLANTDVVRAHTQGGSNSTSATCMFTIVKVSN